MSIDRRTLAVASAGFSTFLNLYSPQPLLPSLARDFGVGASEISGIMTASTLAIALTAPFSGALADMLGRKRVITSAMLAAVIPMVGVAFAGDVSSLIAWRFLQGLLLPLIFVVTVAYIGDEWPPTEVAGAAGIYVMGSSVGGFCGRLIPGILADLLGWREAFFSLAALSLLGALVVAALLPYEKKFVRSPGMRASARAMLRHLKDPQLIATYAIGFGVLFNFIAIFTYVSFHLAGPPFGLSPTGLGAIFVTYLAGAAISPLTGRMTLRFGHRPLLLGVLAAWACGTALTLVPGIIPIIAGPMVCATCGMLCQTLSTSYVTAFAREGRSAAVGLYVTAFYVGGSMGAFLPGLAWTAAGWPGCVAMVIAMLAAMGLISVRAYKQG